jgi:hypothetical protein
MDNLVNADLAGSASRQAAKRWSWSKILFALVKAVRLQTPLIYVTDSKSKGGFKLVLAIDRIQGRVQTRHLCMKPLSTHAKMAGSNPPYKAFFLMNYLG